MGGHVARRERGVCWALMEKSEGKRPPGRPGGRSEDNIKRDLGEVGRWGGGDIDWIDVCKDRDKWRAVVNAVMNLWFP